MFLSVKLFIKRLAWCDMKEEIKVSTVFLTNEEFFLLLRHLQVNFPLLKSRFDYSSYIIIYRLAVIHATSLAVALQFSPSMSAA